MGKEKLNVPASIKKYTILLVIAYVFNFVGFTFLISTMSLTGKALLTGSGAAGVPLSLLSGVALFSALPFGQAADKLGRKAAILIMIAAYAMGDLVGAIAIKAQSGTLYLISMGLVGIGVGAMALFATAVTDLYPAKFKGRASGFAQLGVMAANTLGYLIAAPIITAFGTTAVYYVAFGCQVVAVVLILLLKEDPRDVGRKLQSYWPRDVFNATELEPVVVKAEAVPPQQNRSSLKLAFLWPIFLAVILRVWIHLGANFINVALPVAFSAMGYTLAATSTFLVTRALAAFLFASPSGHLIDRYGRKFGFIAAPAATIIGILMLTFLQNPVCMYTGCALIGIGNAIANVVPGAVCNDVTYLSERSRAVAIFGISTNIGGFIFPVPMAMILAKYGLSGLAIACSVFLIIPILLSAFTLHETEVGHFKGYEPELSKTIPGQTNA